MNELMLSTRLKTVANYIPDQSKLADIGSDHAYLPTYLARLNKIASAIAVEVNEGPYLSALEQVQSTNCNDMIEVRKGNGLSVIEKGEVDTIVIAGMGGRLIRDILHEGIDKLTRNMKLILQPNVGSERLRFWLMEHQWQIVAENILEEDGKIYEVIVAEYSVEPVLLSEDEILFGPILLREKSPAFIKKWKDELRKWHNIFQSLSSASQTEENDVKKEEFLKKIKKVKEVID